MESGWGLPRPITKSHAGEKWAWPWAREAPKNFKIPFNIFATAEASDFKFGMQIGISKAHYKITPKGKSGRGPGLGKLTKIRGFPSIFLQRLKLATSYLVCSLGLPRAIIKSHQKSGRGHGLGEIPKILEFPFNIFAAAEASDFKFGLQFGFSKAHYKITSRGKSGRSPGLGELLLTASRQHL